MDRLLTTVDEVQEELAQHLGREPDPACWDELLETLWVEEVVESSVLHGSLDPTLWDDFVARYRRLEARFGTRSGVPKPRRTRHEIPRGLFEEAVTTVIAQRAAELPRLGMFRTLRSDDLPLPFDAVANWVEERAALALSGAGPTLLIEVPVEVPPEGLPRANAQLDAIIRELEAMKSAAEWQLGSWRLQVLSYPTPDGSVGRVPIARLLRPAGAAVTEAIRAWRDLDALRRVAEELCNAFPGWTEADAVGHALTSVVPMPSPGVASGRSNALVPTLGRVVLDLSPLLDPRDVVNLYRKARVSLLGAHRRSRSPSEAAIRLASFIADLDRAANWSWAMAAEEWNKSGLGRKYEWRDFRRQAINSYRQVTGLEFERGNQSQEDKADG